jgi:hypothetical protein
MSYNGMLRRDATEIEEANRQHQNDQMEIQGRTLEGYVEEALPLLLLLHSGSDPGAARHYCTIISLIKSKRAEERDRQAAA